MKTTQKIFALALLFVGLTLHLNAQENNNSLLWKIEGDDIKTSYVFGTFHVLPKKDFEFKDKVKQAFSKTEAVVLELDMDDPNMQGEFMKHSMLTDGQELKSFMDDDEYVYLDTFFKDKMGFGMAQLNTLKPFTLSSMAMISKFGKDAASYEATILTMAAEAKKEVKGLETVEFQMSLFDKQSYEEQIDDIIKLLKDEEKEGLTFDDMVALYKTEDIDALYNFMNTYFEQDDEIIKLLLSDRNENWIDKMEAYAKAQSTFFAVGAGHLPGKKGVINLLKEAGFTVTPIFN